MILAISKSSGEPISIGEVLVCTLNNIISRVVVGRKCYNEEGRVWGFLRMGSVWGLPRMLCELGKLLGAVHIGDMFPP